LRFPPPRSGSPASAGILAAMTTPIEASPPDGPPPGEPIALVDGDAAGHESRAVDAGGAEDGGDVSRTTDPGPVSDVRPSADAVVSPSYPPPPRLTVPEIAAAVCPYLGAATGSWRMATPSREHRCLGLTPPTPQTTEKQRRHCLSADHVDCPIYRAAREARATTLAGVADPARIAAADEARRPLPRTAPILLEPPRLIDQVTRLQLDRAPGQLALVALMAVAFAVVAVSRFATPDPGASPSPSSVAVPLASPSPSPPTPSPSPSASASFGPSSSPSAEPSYRTTYKVKRGDTLSELAATFKTTVKAIRELNHLTTNTLHIGQILKIP